MELSPSRQCSYFDGLEASTSTRPYTKSLGVNCGCNVHGNALPKYTRLGLRSNEQEQEHWGGLSILLLTLCPTSIPPLHLGGSI